MESDWGRHSVLTSGLEIYTHPYIHLQQTQTCTHTYTKEEKKIKDQSLLSVQQLLIDQPETWLLKSLELVTRQHTKLNKTISLLLHSLYPELLLHRMTEGTGVPPGSGWPSQPPWTIAKHRMLASKCPLWRAHLHPGLLHRGLGKWAAYRHGRRLGCRAEQTHLPAQPLCSCFHTCSDQGGSSTGRGTRRDTLMAEEEIQLQSVPTVTCKTGA